LKEMNEKLKADLPLHGKKVFNNMHDLLDEYNNALQLVANLKVQNTTLRKKNAELQKFKAVYELKHMAKNEFNRAFSWWSRSNPGKTPEEFMRQFITEGVFNYIREHDL